MYRKAHLVEASTVYDGYFKETFIPQGSVDSHGCGEISSNLHHIQAAKQTCAGDPELTKSIIRYVMKQTSFDGLLPAGNKGYGFIPTDSYTDSNLQLEVMNAVAEYLKKTGDYAFIDEWIESYPVERGDLISVRQILELYLLDLIEKDDLSPSRLAVQGAYLPEFVKQMENSGKMTEIYMKELKAYADADYLYVRLTATKETPFAANYLDFFFTDGEGETAVWWGWTTTGTDIYYQEHKCELNENGELTKMRWYPVEGDRVYIDDYTTAISDSEVVWNIKFPRSYVDVYKSSTNTVRMSFMLWNGWDGYWAIPSRGSEMLEVTLP
jgi:hypothetical protein